VEKIVLVRRRGAAGARERRAPHVLDAAFEQEVGARLDPSGDLRIGRPAVRRVVLEAAALGRIVRWRDDDAVGKSRAALRL
jgi:hypothetical protein